MDTALTVYLHGNLRTRFGGKFELYVEDAAEAIRALCAKLPGFRYTIQNGRFRVRLGSIYLRHDTLEQGLHDKQRRTLHITPVVHGAGGKNQGVMTVVIGIIMIVLAVATNGWSLTAAWAAAPGMILGGAAMILNGVAQLLTKMPAPQNPSDAEKTKSTSFSNLDNTMAQGQPVPLVYGEIMVGSRVLSQGLSSYKDDDDEPLKASPKPSKRRLFGGPRTQENEESAEKLRLREQRRMSSKVTRVV